MKSTGRMQNRKSVYNSHFSNASAHHHSWRVGRQSRTIVFGVSLLRYRWIFVFLSVVVVAPYSIAQVVPYSQYYNAPLHTNPSLAAQTDYTQLAVQYRRSRVANYEIPSVTFMYPFYHQRNGLRAGGLGAHVVRHQAGPGGAFAVTGAMGTFAYTIHLATKHRISAGLQGGFMNKRLDPSRITTDNQFNFGAFDPSLSHGENFQPGSKTKPVINSGFSYTYSDSSNAPKAIIGVAFFNMNRPAYEFIADGGREELTYTITGEVLLLKSGRASFHPMVRYVSGVTSFANVGAQVRYEVPGGNTMIGAGAWYKTTKALVGALQYSNTSYVLAASLDVSAASNLTANINNAFELSFSWRLKRRAKYKPVLLSTAPVSSSSQEKSEILQQEFSEELQHVERIETEVRPESSEANKIEVEVSHSVRVVAENEPATIPNVTSELTPEERSILDTRIEFKLGSSELTPASVEFIETKLVPVLKNHPHHVLHITGHCCTIGDKAVNEKISIHRAEAIAQVLIGKGISEKNVVVSGLDFQKPIATNNTEAGRQKNRRAEFELLEQ